MKWIAFAMVALAAASPVAGRDTTQWSRVLRLHPGTKVALDLADGRRIFGTFERASQSDLTCQCAGEITVKRDDVVRVGRKPRLNRAVRTLLGAAIGLGFGAIVNATLGAELHNEGRDITAATLGGGAAIGAGLGALSAPRGFQTVYQRSATPAHRQK